MQPVPEAEDEKPAIEVSPNGPLIVTGLRDFRNSRDEPMQVRPVTALCRCGSSGNKPFCDGTHSKIGFSGGKLEGRLPDKADEYEGRKITIHDNRGVCSHAGFCTDSLKSVFRMGEEPWIDPDGADAQKIIEVIKKCPSGALSYSIDGTKHGHQRHEPVIRIAKDGPYAVLGELELKDQSGSSPQSKELYTLCRCGGSKNKPFCDGTHWHINFSDEKN